MEPPTKSDDIARRLAALEQSTARIEITIARLSTIIEGKPPFPGLTPLLEDVKQIKEDVERINELVERAKWAAGALGISNITGIIAFISSFFGRG